jgi:hypothetical protein
MGDPTAVAIGRRMMGIELVGNLCRSRDEISVTSSLAASLFNLGRMCHCID